MSKWTPSLLSLLASLAACRPAARPVREAAPGHDDASRGASGQGGDERRGERGPVLLFHMSGGEAFPLTCFAPDGGFTDALDTCLEATAGVRPLPVAFRDGKRGAITRLPESGGFDACVDGFPVTGGRDTDELDFAYWPPDATVTFISAAGRDATAGDLARLPADARPKKRDGVRVLALDMDGDGAEEELFLADGAGLALVEHGHTRDDLGEVPLSDLNELDGAFAIGARRAVMIEFSDRASAEEVGEGPSGTLLLDGRSRKTVGGMVCNP